MLFLLVQPGAAPLLTVAVLLQRVEDLVGELQVHLHTITHQESWSKLEGEEMREEEEVKDTATWSETRCLPGCCGGCSLLTLSMRAMFLRPQASSSCLVVMFLPFPLKPRRGAAWGRSAMPYPTHTHRYRHSEF